MNFRDLVLISAFGSFALQPIPALGMAPVASLEKQTVSPQIVKLPVGQDRVLDLYVYIPATKPRAVLFLSHGGGSTVQALEPIILRLLDEQFAVVAPLHSDSLALPADKRENLQVAFGSRIADLGAATSYAKQRFNGLPLGGFGYSYGSLTSMIGAGALDYVAPAKVPEMKAVLTFSSPGIIPGLMMPDMAFAKVDVPTMMITGTKDVVPGFVKEPRDHLVAFEKAPAGGRYAVVVKDADHEFIKGSHPAFLKAWGLAMDFYKATLLNDVDATQRLEKFADDDTIDFMRR